MLVFHVAFVETSEIDYTPNSLYTSPLPVAQRNTLYLATALSTRGHQVTIFQAACDNKTTYGNLTIAPLAHLKGQETRFNTLVYVDNVGEMTQLPPIEEQDFSTILWSFQAPQHLSLLPFKSKDLHDQVELVLFANPVHRQPFSNLYEFPLERSGYFPVAMTRTLRKRFKNTLDFKSTRPAELTLSFIQRPEQGLQETLDIFETLQQGFKGLQLQVLLPCDERPWSDAEESLIERCKTDPNIRVYRPQNRPAYVEQLMQSHVLCAPAMARDPNNYGLIDALAAGCHCIVFEDPGIATLGKEGLDWVETLPEDSQWVRYTSALAKRLREWDEDPEAMVQDRFRAVAHMGTYFTWDLRVWEFESLLFQLRKNKARCKAKS